MVVCMTRRAAQQRFNWRWRLWPIGRRIDLPFFFGLLAQLEAEAVDAEAALARIDEALGSHSSKRGRFCLAFLHRIRGDLLLKRDPAETTRAEDAFATQLRSRRSKAHEASPPSSPGARQALPIDRPPRRSPRGPRAGARRLFADARNARDRRGAGAAGGAGGDRRSQGRRSAARAAAASSNGVRPSDDVDERFRRGRNKGRLRARGGIGGDDATTFGAFRRVHRSVGRSVHARRIALGARVGLGASCEKRRMRVAHGSRRRQ